MSCDGSPYRYSGSTMNTEDYSANAMASVIASCTSVGVQGAASLPRCECENARKRSSFSGTMDLSDYDIGEEDGFEDCMLFGGKKRRLTFEQVKRLEKSFEVANKLEPERKIQLAKALGLQPRQIAVWFQNRRARCKTKQVEKDFDGLKKEYDALKNKYDILLEENKRFKAERLNRESGNNNQNSADVSAFDFEIEPQQNSTNSVLQPTDFPMELSVESNVCRKCAEPLRDIYSMTGKEQVGGCCSIVSEVASSLLNIDSPLTIDSPPSPRFSQIIAAAANSSPVIAVEGSSFGEQIVAGGLESPPPGHESHCLQETLPEVEVDQIASLNQADVTCRNLFYSLDEQGPLNLWEYWPQ